ncbi:hypothetical protein GSQ54_22380, partial [Clostridioides difficile]|nr:hypothetical protein [Clostridioides difficile]
GMGKIRNVNQSLLRGGNTYNVFYSFNPPESQRNWANMEVLEMMMYMLDFQKKGINLFHLEKLMLS